MKNILIFLGVAVAAGVGWYLISPVFNDIEADEASPLEGLVIEDRGLQKIETQPMEETGMMRGVDTMDENTKTLFDQEMELTKDQVNEMDEPQPEAGPAVVAQGAFVANAHDVAGSALLIKSGSETTLRFEDFDTINGPNLHIYLASDLSETDYVDLGPIKATKGNVNYTVDASIDTQKYNKVLVWCVPFKVLFSYAELK